jgi:hypothetical protein
MYSGRRESVDFKGGTGLLVRKGQEEDREKKRRKLRWERKKGKVKVRKKKFAGEGKTQ